MSCKARRQGERCMWTKLLISIKKSVYLNYLRTDQDIPFMRAIPGAHPMEKRRTHLPDNLMFEIRNSSRNSGGNSAFGGETSVNNIF